MRTLTKIIAPALVAALGFGAALPASAHETRHEQAGRYTQDRYGMDRSRSIRADIQGLRAQIDRAAARHRISYREASGLHRDASQIQRLYASYARDGLSHRETQVLKTKIDRVQFALHMERADRNGRRS